MPGRALNAPDYRFGFNGQEKVDELKGDGNHNTAMFWEYDTRLGRRWNQDPKPNIALSSYSVFSDNPILINDPKGDTTYVYNSKGVFQFPILDQLTTNEIVFMSDFMCNTMLSFKESGKYENEVLGSVARMPTFIVAKINTKTAQKMGSSRQKSGWQHPERMGALWIDNDTKELKSWECKDCGVYNFMSDESKMFNRDGSFKGENVVTGLVKVKWHTHTGKTNSETNPTPPEYNASDRSSTIMDYWLGNKIEKGGLFGIIISDETFTIYNMVQHDSELKGKGGWKKFDLKTLGERKLK